MQTVDHSGDLITVDTRYGTLEGSCHVGRYAGMRIGFRPPARYAASQGELSMFVVHVPAVRITDAETVYTRMAEEFAESKVKWLEKRFPEWIRSVRMLEKTGTTPGKLLPYRGSMIRIGYHDERVVTLRGFDGGQKDPEAPSDFSEAPGAVLYLPSAEGRCEGKVLVGGREMKLQRYSEADREKLQNLEMIRAWYCSQAMRICEPRTREFAKKTGAVVRNVGWTWGRGLWGRNKISVIGGRKNGLYESIRIVYHPLCVAFSDYELDALIWHELAHCAQANHQKGFYDVLLSWLPDYRQRDKAFRESAWVKDVLSPEL